MPSHPYIDLSELFENLPAEGGQRLPVQSSGFCWFKSPEGYPDKVMVEEFVESADLYTDTGDGFEKACTAAHFPMKVYGDSSNEDEAGVEAIESLWNCLLSTGPSENTRRYLLESASRDVLFVGHARAEHVVALMEIASPLAIIGSTGINLNDQCSGGSHCRPWAYELVSADTSDVMKEAVSTRLAEHVAASEFWMACTHNMYSEMNFALFRRAESSGVLEHTFQWTFHTPKHCSGRFFRALLFWHNENTDKMLPWHVQ